MANYEESTNIKLDWAMPFMRTGKFPLDRSSMFSSYEDAVKYAKGDTSDPDSRGLCGSSYIGQQICVYENDEVKIYVIDQDRAIKAINDNGTLVVMFTGSSDNIKADHTIDEILQASQDGKNIIGFWNMSGGIYCLPLLAKEGTRVYFNITMGLDSVISQLNIIGTRTSSDDIWELQMSAKDLDTFQTKANLTTSITSSSTDIQYPSAKAVYDSITESSNNFIVNITSGETGNETIAADKTYDEIKSAIDNKKNVIGIVLGGDVVVYMVPYAITHNNTIIFNSLIESNIVAFKVDNNSVWSVASAELVRSSQITNLIKDDTNLIPSSAAVYNALAKKIDKTSIVQSTGQDTDSVMSQKAIYEYGQSIKTLDLTNTTSNQIVSIATVDEKGAPKSYTTLDIASDDDVNTMITEVLGSYSTQQQPSSIILNSNTTDSTKQFELTIDDTGTLTSQEL